MNDLGWVNGFSGGLTFHVSVPGIAGVPGEPFELDLTYDSSFDDAGTFGTHVNLDRVFRV